MRAEDRIVPAAAGHGRLRASDSDRERVLDILKTAFAQGRLTKDEFDARVGQTLAARTWGDLAALTSDIPAWPIPRPVRKPARTSSNPPAHAVIKAVACAIISLAAITLAGMPGIWTMPAPPAMTAQACHVFDSWQNTTTPSHGPALSVAASTASNGSDPRLAADLAALDQAFQRYEGLGGPQSAAARHLIASQVKADTSLVRTDCLNDGY